MTEKQQSDGRVPYMSDKAIPFPDEIEHLNTIHAQLSQALTALEADVKRIDQEYMDVKRYMSEYRGEIDPHEMFQTELGLRQIDRSGPFAVEMRDTYAKIKDSPYFARIDFRALADSHEDVVYIGRFAFRYDNQLLISDWRSPFAGMFYDCELGPAGYTAPSGTISGEMLRKRQFKIKDGMMEYAFESAIHIQDHVLQQELSHSSDDKMKSIIATIQKEQNQIIRNEKAGTLIIQGVAGSGKTSIALHRVAFLLYRFQHRLSSKQIAILSPNKVFGNYISNVLPELGEEPICELNIEEIAGTQLRNIVAFEPAQPHFGEHSAAWIKRARLKSTLDFVKQLDRFIQEMPDLIFEPNDYSYGQLIATADFISERFNAYQKYPVKHRLQKIAEDILNGFAADPFGEDNFPKSNAILKALNQMLRIKTPLMLYREFYKRQNMANLFVMPEKKTLEWADVYPFLYLYAAFEGLQTNCDIKHLVIDEMQDYTPIQLSVLNLLFPCQKTILGDFGQCIHPNHLHKLEDIQTLYQEAEYIELKKSYRSTYEIISFAKQIKGTNAIDAMERHGAPPDVIHCADKEHELRQLRRKIHSFPGNPFLSLGIIVKTNEDAAQLYELLAKDYEVSLISPDSTQFTNGISITSIHMAKGLEFDEVLIPDVCHTMYHSEYDRNLLYIACTRAMHLLTLSYTGEVSPLIGHTNDEMLRHCQDADSPGLRAIVDNL